MIQWCEKGWRIGVPVLARIVKVGSLPPLPFSSAGSAASSSIGAERTRQSASEVDATISAMVRSRVVMRRAPLMR